MERKFAKTCSYLVLVLVLSVGVIAAATSNSLVSAQACTAQLGSPTNTVQQYYASGFQVTLPLSSTCPFYTGQLYATGTAYDTTNNWNIGTSNTALSSTYGGYGFNGQLQFTLPNTAVSHPVQFSVSIYGTQAGYWQQYSGGSLLTTTSATFVVGPSYLNGYQNYPYGYSSTYPTYPSTYPTYPTYPSTYPSYPAYHGFVYNPGNSYYQNPSPAYNQNTGGYYSHSGGYYNNNNHGCTRFNNACYHR
jgi:hypothetical protein